jgi:hypothetical protein
LVINRKEDRNRIANFWRLELPLLMYEARFKLLYAFLFFFGACILGWVSAANDDTFVRLIMGDSYVNQTSKTLKKVTLWPFMVGLGKQICFYKLQSTTLRFHLSLL